MEQIAYEVSEADGSLEVCAVVNNGTVVNPVTISVSLSPVSATGKYSYNCVIHTERTYVRTCAILIFINKNGVILCSEGDEYVLEDEVVTLDAGSSVGCATIRIVSDDLIEGPEDFIVQITTDDAFAVISNDLALVTITGEIGEEEKKEWEMEEKDREKRKTNHSVMLFSCFILYGLFGRSPFLLFLAINYDFCFLTRVYYWKTVLFNVQRW